MSKKIPVFSVSFDGNESRYVQECIQSGWISSEGPYVRRFESEFAALHGMPWAVSVTNGTAALDLALLALELQPGDEVILPAFTIISCVSAVLRAGGSPVLVDCDPVTWNMNVVQVEARITERTRAIMAVHIYGLCPDMDHLMALTRGPGLCLIEDGAESIGLEYGGKLCGGFGQISTFSFYANKHVTTGEGGMILTVDPRIQERCRYFRNLCFMPGRRFVHEDLGWNYRLSGLQAAVGLAQLEKLPATIARKREIGAKYDELLGGCPRLQRPATEMPKARNVYWVYGVVLSDDVGLSVAEVRTKLEERGIETRPFFWPIHEQPVLQNQGLFPGESFPQAERLGRRGFYLPTGLCLDTKDQETIARALIDVID